MQTDLIQSLHLLVGRHAETRGADLAYQDAEEEISWARLWERSGRWAGHLADAGVGRGDRVVIALPDQVPTVVAWLAVHRASAVAVPIDPNAGRSHLEHVIRDSGAAFGFVADDHRLEGAAIPLAILDSRVVTGLDDRDPTAEPRDDLLLDESAFQLYTSGTTGTPKGVVSTQRAALWAVAACYGPILGLGAESRVVWPLPLHHSLSHIYAILGVLATGARCRLVSGAAATDVLDAVVEDGATELVGVPTLYGRMVRALRDHHRPLSTLRTCLVSGASGPRTLPDEFAELTGRGLVNIYGATETSGPITTTIPGSPAPEGSCGLPVPGVTVRIVDPDTGFDVGTGAEGEVWVSTPGIMLGYHDLPDVTAHALDHGYYRTGDLAHRDDLGYLHIHGRRDDLIIRGGANMHPAEIEDVLRTVPGVADAAVTGRPDDDLGQVPVAFLVPAGDQVDPAAVVAACLRELGPSKVPAELHLVDDLPRTASGKVLRRALDPATATPLPMTTPAVEAAVPARIDTTRPDDDLADDLIALVERATAEALGSEGSEFSDDDAPFRDRGLTSLGAVRVRDALGAATGLRLPAGIVFDHPTPRRLAAHLHHRLRPGRGPVTPRRVAPAPADDPIVIVGMACRYPGGIDGPDALWQVAREGRDVLSAFPTDRGWTVPADVPARGGFLTDVAGFDAEFFGISPREALVMDPQQRLLLEVSWEALENAGIDPTSLRGKDGGVFTGLMMHDYLSRDGDLPDEALGHVETGNAGSVASGRVAYVLDLRGPALTVDTACSSSLVALHLAAQAVRRGECEFALAGGVTVMATPTVFVDMHRQGALSPTGRVRPFAADADGTAWSEGVGVLVVERLSTARAAGHPVLALVRGTAVNQDGASNGLTAPNGTAQQRVVTSALVNAGLSVSDVDVVEAHGTGTVLGDPIEAEALLATYGRRAGAPLRLGSVKSCIGHTQAAAGVAGVITMVAALRAGVLPATGATGTPSTLVDWESAAVELLTESVPWPRGSRPRRAGVSSFGISGTNTHVIIEEAPTAPPVPVAPGPFAGARFAAVPVSARSESALAEYVERVEDALRRDGAVSAALLTRPRFDHRAVLLGDVPTVSAAVVPGADTGVVFVFGGQGAQWVGMGRELLDSSPVFARRLHECDAALREVTGFSVVDVVREGRALDDVGVVQPVLFAVAVSLAEVWRSCGVGPSAVVGHSQGEVAAACVAGVLSLEDAARVVGVRSRLLTALAGTGGMVVAVGGVDRITALAEECPGVSVAAVNGPGSVVVSGTVSALTGFVTRCEDAGVDARWVEVDYASHSPAVEVLRDELAQGLVGLGTGTSSGVAYYSAVTGGRLDPRELDAGYWFRNLRQPVLFGDAVAACVRDGHRMFVEVGPHPVVAGPVGDVAAALGVDTGVVGTLRRGEGGADRFVRSLAQAWALGAPVRWDRVLSGVDGGIGGTAAPTYPFQHERFWLARRPAVTDAGPTWRALSTGDTAALGRMLGIDDHEALDRVVPALAALIGRETEHSALDAWRYRVDWRPKSLPRGTLHGTWLVADLGGRGAILTDALAHRGARALAVTGEEDLRDALAGEPVAGVVAILDGADHPAGQALTLARAMADAEVPLWLVTAGAADTVPDPAQAGAWGIGQVVALEQPHLWGGLIDLPTGEPTTDLADRVVDVLAAGTDEDQVAVRADGLLVRRVARAERTATAVWRPHGTVVLTGASGSIGPDVARWLLAEGVTDLVLVSRSGADTSHLAGPGIRVEAVSCDVTDPAAVRALVDGLAAAGRPVRTIVHAAADLTLAALADLDADRLAALGAAKTAGARNLVAALDPDNPATVVLFSSIAGVWGSGDHGAYAAANAELDAYAQQCRADGLPVTSIAWGIWSSAAGRVPDLPDRLRRQGVVPMSPAAALPALRAALAGTSAPVEIVADIDWPAFLPAYASARTRPLMSDLVEAAPPVESGTGWRDDLVPLPAPTRRERALTLVTAQLRSVLGLSDAAPVRQDQPLREFGLDSMMAVELRDRLQRATGLRLLTTVVFDHPTVTRLAAHLVELAVPPGLPVSAVASPVVEDLAEDPVVIVGMACRLPGGIGDPDALWQAIMAGTDSIGPLPTDRGWDLARLHGPAGAAGSTVARGGGFLTGAADFDATLFGISPREAVAMDPQQRVLLETCWEALERAGLDPTAMGGEPVGVYVGASAQPYGAGLGEATDEAEAHLVTGTAGSVLSGRLSYTFGFAGPAVTIDTACSSSLVALHVAARAIRSGECRAAVVGGVAVMASGAPLSAFTRQGALAADGRCKAFADEANGIGLAEGAGVLVLERLSDARRAGHAVLAVVRGSAVNQDGTSNGLSAPSGTAQGQVLRQALADARLDATGVDLVEAHGTGTPLGDPIEASALLAVYGDRPAERPLWLGSVKSNLGHTQAAAGVTGVIKAVLALRHGLVPPTLHADHPSTRVDWTSGAVRLAQETRPWPENGRSRRAAVSSFGISGTNAHVILEQAPDPVPVPAPEPVLPGLPVPVVVSAATASALTAQVAALSTGNISSDSEVAAVARTLAGRARLPHRAVVLATDRDDLTAGLADVTAGRTSDRVGHGQVPAGRTVGFVFPGQGSQWVGMTGELVRTSPVFRDAFAECDAALEPHLGMSVLGSVLGEAGAPPLDRLRVVQPALFATAVSLARLWQACGVEPAAVVGHSQGEVAAAHVAGALTLPDAALVVARRALALDDLAGEHGRGAMAAVLLPLADVEADLAAFAGRVVVAAVNAPGAVVVSGETEAVEALAARWNDAGVRVRRVVGAHVAGHSPLIDPALDRCRDLLAGVTPVAGGTPFYSTVTGTLLPTADLDGRYWLRNLREPVRFDTAARALLADGVGVVIEMSPHPTLVSAVTAIAEESGHDAVRVVESIRRGENCRTRFLTSLAAADLAGAPVDWAAVLGGGAGAPVPTYAFQRTRYWLPDRAAPTEQSTVEGLAYEVVWRPVPAVSAPTVGTWTLLAADSQTDDPVVTAVERALRERGAEVRHSGLEGNVVSFLDLDGLDSLVPSAGRLHVVTRGLVGPALYGAGRVAALDHGVRWGGIVDIAAEPDDAVGDLVCAALAQPDEDHLAVRDGRLLAPRLESLAVPVPDGSPWTGATVVIVGADSAPGTELARWVTGAGARAVTLPSTCDPTDPDALTEFLTTLADGTPLVVVHLDSEDAVAALDIACRAVPVRDLVLSTSTDGILGAPGAAARAAVDTLAANVAARRRADGLPGTAIAWGPWALGPTEHDPATADLVRRHGFRPMAVATALTELDRIVAAGNTVPATVLVADIDWTRLSVALTANRPQPLLDTVKPAGHQATAAPRDLREVVRRHVSDVLGHAEPGGIADDRAFRELGFDSVTAVDLRNRLRADTGLPVPTTLVFDHPTIDAVTAFLTELATTGEPAAAPTVPARAERADDPVVIVGIGCRYPGGVRSADDLWRLVETGGDAIGGFPTDRGWDVTGLSVRDGGFLHDAADFDAGFFGIGPREALAMDPQQRLLLETAWEALEHAGVDPTTLRGEPVGTYIGSSYRDHELRLRDVPDELRGHLGNGSAASVLSGRIAYLFGLEGPTLTVDTACSSSLVALHLAARAVRDGECRLALAGGVMVMSAPGLFDEFERQGALAGDGRCKAFAASADGMGISEGVGVLVLERLSDAVRAGHEVLAVVAGSAVNQDGASNGMTAPSGPAQQRVIAAALANAGLTVSDVDVVEAHGTGTKLGDPIEAGAVLATYGRRTGAPVRLGSVKSNLGHTGASAGVAGVIKMVMSLRHKTIPATLHAAAPSPHVDWTAGAVALTHEAQPWPSSQDRPRYAGVSSFGLSGTNAHVVIGEAPPAPATAAPPAPAVCAWPVSGRGPDAVRAQVDRLRSWLTTTGAGAAEIGRALAARAALPHRAVVWGRDRDDLTARLDALPDTVITGEGLCLVFSGQGGQRSGMGLQLADHYPAFATALDEVERELAPWLDRPLRTLLAAPDDTLARTGATQLAVFAVQIGLARLWESWGVVPDAVVGHSVGELAAVHVAGGLSLRAACALVGQRARLMDELPDGGAMAALAATEDTVRRLLAARPDVVVAAVNATDAVVVSGAADGVAEVVAAARAAGIRVRRLRVSHAFHSPAVDPVLGRYRDVVASVLAGSEVADLRVPVVSSVTGAPLTRDEMRSPDHWVTQLRATVRFADATDTVVRRGVTRFLELGPDASLTGALRDHHAIAVSALRRDRPSEPDAVVEAAARLFRSGVDIDWTAVNTPSGPVPVRRVALPTYAFRRTRFWFDTKPASGSSEQLGHRLEWTDVPVGAVPTARPVLVVDAASADLGAHLAACGVVDDVLPLRNGAEIPSVLRATQDVVACVDTARPGGRDLLLALAHAVPRLPGIRMRLLTRGAVAAGAGDPVPAPGRAWTWGFGLSFGREHPGAWGGVVDLPADLDGVPADLLRAVLAGAGTEDQLAVRGARVLGRRLRPHPLPAAATWPTDGSTLVTGGTGGLGAAVARRLAAQGVPRLVLVSRRGPAAPGAAELVEELTGLGADVAVVPCDVTDRDALAALVDGEPALRAVVHTAGVLRDGLLDDLTTADLDEVFDVKAGAALELHALTAGRDLGAFVLFSSFAGVDGATGQANYAGANAVLDALAHHRRHLGLPAVSVAWGGWDAGMASDPQVRARARRTGMRLLAPAAGAEAVLRAVAGDDPAPVVADIDWAAFAATRSGPPNPALTELLPRGHATARLADRLQAVSPGRARHLVRETVRDHVLAVLGHPPGTDVDLSAGFLDLGFTSLSGVEFRNALATATGLTLATTLVFDHATPLAVAAHVSERLVPGETPPAAETDEIDGMDASALLRAAREWDVA